MSTAKELKLVLNVLEGRELQKQYGFVKEKEETQLRIKAQGIQTANNLVLEPDEKNLFLIN